MYKLRISKNSIKKLVKKVLCVKGDNWFNDPNREFRINGNEVKKYFDSVKSTPLSKKGERTEAKTIIGLINIRPGMKILDLGCGEGRWAKVLEDKNIEYTGVDFSKELIDKAKNIDIKGSVTFINKPAQDFISEEKFDLIFLFGLITYMNDEDIRKLNKNCRFMLKKGGRLILRDVALNDKCVERKVHDDKNDFLRKIYFFRAPRYQLIRRSLDAELKLFKEFSLIHEQRIRGTNLNIKIFKWK